jgi:hypothetical protein
MRNGPLPLCVTGPPSLHLLAVRSKTCLISNEVPSAASSCGAKPNDRPDSDSRSPRAQKLPIAPIFIADKVSLAVSREKDWKLRIIYAGWDD